MAKIIRTIPEPNKRVDVVRECDVVVVAVAPAASARPFLQHAMERIPF